jgi:hypothetical protein
MSKASKRFRKRAANHLRQSRKEPEGRVKKREKALAAGYKVLAQGEEWLGGENRRSKKREPNRRVRCGLPLLVNQRSNQIHEGAMLRPMLLREKCNDFHHTGLPARGAVQLMNNIEVSSLVLAQEPAVTIRALIKFNLRHGFG